MTRAEHIRWAKQRALEYIELGDLQQAYSSMVSDLNKHEDTWKMMDVLTLVGLGALRAGKEPLREWITGFAE